MHMADALVSPVIGGAGWLAAAGLAGYCARRLDRRAEEVDVPLMGVSAAFVFAAQMINFTIPGTGSSGHLGGGLLLAVMLGPHGAFLAMASILTVQSLFFADGGLLALGCNVVNLGLFPCFIAYPLLFRPIAGAVPTRARLTVASVAAAVVALQLGSLGVVLETRLSGISALPTGPFLLLMQPIHLAIGAFEGVATATVLLFVWRAHPEVLQQPPSSSTARPARPARLVGVLLGVTVLMAGLLSLVASSLPDGLEWSMAAVSGEEEMASPQTGAHGLAADVQRRTAVLPDYSLAGESGAADQSGASQPGPAAVGGTSLAGLIGAAVTLLVAILLGGAVKWRSRAARL